MGCRNKYFLLILTLGITANALYAQNEIPHTFLSTRLVNGHSVETVERGMLDFRVDHRFGDIAGDNGGFHNFYGLDNLSDVRIAFEYGFTENFTAGIGRSKGVTIPEALDGYLKYRLLTQTKDNSAPLSITLLESATFSAAKAAEDPASPLAFDNFNHRLSYATQLLLARRFGDRFSLQLMPAFSHRNFTAFYDDNNIWSLGAGGRLRISKMIAVLGEYHYAFRDDTDAAGAPDFQNTLSAGLEFDTGGHIFHVLFTNARGIIPNEYMSHTTGDWGQGEFRFGFHISRPFRLAGKKFEE